MVVGAHPMEAIAYHASSSSPTVERTPTCAFGADRGDHRRELSFGVGAVGAHRHRPVAPPVGVGVDSDEDAQLERTGAALADRALHDRIIGRSRPNLMGNPMGMMGNAAAHRRRRQHHEQDFLERTTGFEPATLTLARLWFPSAESVPVP